MSRFEPLSPWVRVPADLQPALAGEQRADVAIIGGGYTGFCAALRLKAQGVDVASSDSRNEAAPRLEGRCAAILSSHFKR